jgi:hypothetical protein
MMHREARAGTTLAIVLRGPNDGVHFTHLAEREGVGERRGDVTANERRTNGERIRNGGCKRGGQGRVSVDPGGVEDIRGECGRSESVSSFSRSSFLAGLFFPVRG